MNRSLFSDRMRNESDHPVIRRPTPFWRKKYLLERLREKVAELHQKGVKGDKKAVGEAFSLLEYIQRNFPTDNLMEAYYGSVLTLQGRDAIDPIERLEKVRQGLKVLDAAVQNEPENIQIRIIRGYICYHLPEVFFHRTATAVEDFIYLTSRFEKDPGIFSNEFFRQVLQDLISAYQILGQDQNSQLIREKYEFDQGKERRGHQ